MSRTCKEFGVFFKRRAESSKKSTVSLYVGAFTPPTCRDFIRYPYTKIEFVERELDVSRPTAAKHLELLAANGFVRKQKIGRTNFYINEPLFSLLTQINLPAE